MKDIIKQLYRIDVIDINEVGQNFILRDEESIYILKEISDLNVLLKRIELLTNRFHRIIKTINDELYIIFNNKKYILLKPMFISEIITKPDLIFINSISEWSISVWENKIDAYRNYLSLNIDINSKVLIYLNYFMGLTENIITYYNNYPLENIRNVICRDRIDEKIYGINYYDPTNVIIDGISRELCDFAIIYNYTCNEVVNLFKEYKFNNDEINLFICRLLYPKKFFSWIDEYLNKRNIDGFDKVIEFENRKIDLYKKLIKTLKKSNYFVEEISWIL